MSFRVCSIRLPVDGPTISANSTKTPITISLSRWLISAQGIAQDSNPRWMSVWLYEERSSVLPYGAPDQRTMLTPNLKLTRHRDECQKMEHGDDYV
jgi:hypothetical protein